MIISLASILLSSSNERTYPGYATLRLVNQSIYQAKRSVARLLFHADKDFAVSPPAFYSRCRG